MFDIAIYDAERHQGGVREVLKQHGWEGRYVAGQLAGLAFLSANLVPGTRSKVYVLESEERLGGYVSIEFREWNRLGQLHGLAVNPDLKRQGVASVLVCHAEEFVQGEVGRGIYVDTPVSNRIARSFYRALGYRQAYTMPEYYDEGLDGVTYLKLFPKLEEASIRE